MTVKEIAGRLSKAQKSWLSSVPSNGTRRLVQYAASGPVTTLARLGLIIIVVGEHPYYEVRITELGLAVRRELGGEDA